MQRTGQRPCADVSALRRAGHRHHQTETESGAHRFGHPFGLCHSYAHHRLGYFSPIHEQGDGSAQGDSTTAAVTLVNPACTLTQKRYNHHQ